MTSKDVKFSVMRTKNLKSKIRRTIRKSVESVETPDDYTVKFTLKEPDAAFLSKLANNFPFAIVDSLKLFKEAWRYGCERMLLRKIQLKNG